MPQTSLMMVKAYVKRMAFLDFSPHRATKRASNIRFAHHVGHDGLRALGHSRLFFFKAIIAHSSCLKTVGVGKDFI